MRKTLGNATVFAYVISRKRRENQRKNYRELDRKKIIAVINTTCAVVKRKPEKNRPVRAQLKDS